MIHISSRTPLDRPGGPARLAQATRRGILAALVLTGTLLALPAAPASAQAVDHLRSLVDGIDTGVGAAVVIPDALLGVGVFHFPAALRRPENRWGLFVDAKMTHRSLENDPNYRTDLTVADADQLNHQRIADENEWILFNAGLIRPLSPEFALLLGGGVGRRTVIREYFDRTQEYSETGTYFVGIPESSGWEAQGVAGVLLRAGPRFVLRLGYETGPGGVSLGGYLVPR